MKKTILILLTVCIAWCTRAQVQSSCLPDAELQARYGNDIKYLALLRMYAIQSLDTAHIEIPMVHQDSVRKAMAAVFNLGNQLEADSVMRRYCIHADYNSFFYHPSMGRRGVSLEVTVDPTKSWTNTWQSLQVNTGYVVLDSLMIRHGFEVKYYYVGSAGTGDVVIIKSPEVINGRAFADSLRLLDGIENVRSAAGATDGNMIRYSADINNAYLVFDMGWGDCPAGCTARKQWHYKIDDQCRVSLDSVRQQGNANPHPVPGNCDITAIKDPVPAVSFMVYPNPATDAVSLSVSGNETYTYKLIDSRGRLMLQGAVKGIISLPLTGFAKGLYWLQVTNKKGNSKSEKLVLD